MSSVLLSTVVWKSTYHNSAFCDMLALTESVCSNALVKGKTALKNIAKDYLIWNLWSSMQHILLCRDLPFLKRVLCTSTGQSCWFGILFIWCFLNTGKNCLVKRFMHRRDDQNKAALHNNNYELLIMFVIFFTEM